MIKNKKIKIHQEFMGTMLSLVVLDLISNKKAQHRSWHMAKCNML